MELIQVSNLYKVYQLNDGDSSATSAVSALQDVKISIGFGEFVAIVGPSGSGKSTLMQILGLLDPPSSGTYKFLGHDVSKLSDNQITYLRSRYIGFVFQMFNLLKKTSALENVVLPLLYAQDKNPEKKAREQLQRLAMEDRLSHLPSQLSGGQQQRVAIARALVNQPKIIFADEPTGNISQQQAKDIMIEFQRLHASGVTIVLVTHDTEIANYAHRLVRIIDGKIVEDYWTKSKGAIHLSLANTLQKKMSLPITNWRLLLENIKIAANALRINKARTILTMLGVIIGVSAVISMIALGQGAKKSIEEDLKSLGSNMLRIHPGNQRLRHVVQESGKVSRISIQDAQAILRLKDVGVPIKEISLEVSGSVQVVNGNKNWNTRLLGVSSNYARVRASEPVRGRFFTEQEDQQKQRLCLIGKTVYSELFAQGENFVGSMIKINRISFQIIGLLPTKGAGFGGDQDDVVVIPLSTAMKRVLGRQYLDSMSVEMNSPEATDMGIDHISKTLRTKHRLHNDQEDDFTIRNMADIQNAVASTTKTMSLLLGAIAAISLLVGGIGIMNIMLVSVKERTREIGLRKAVGARNFDVLLQFLIEAIFMGLVGGTIGILLAATIAWSVSIFFDWAVELTLPGILLAFLFSFGVGLVFGYWPAKQASKLSPIEALRYE